MSNSTYFRFLLLLFLILALPLVLASISGNTVHYRIPGSYCGDGTCDSWESCANCSSDCGICASSTTTIPAGSPPSPLADAIAALPPAKEVVVHWSKSSPTASQTGEKSSPSSPSPAEANAPTTPSPVETSPAPPSQSTPPTAPNSPPEAAKPSNLLPSLVTLLSLIFTRITGLAVNTSTQSPLQTNWPKLLLFLLILFFILLYWRRRRKEEKNKNSKKNNLILFYLKRLFILPYLRRKQDREEATKKPSKRGTRR